MVTSYTGQKRPKKRQRSTYLSFRALILGRQLQLLLPVAIFAGRGRNGLRGRGEGLVLGDGLRGLRRSSLRHRLTGGHVLAFGFNIRTSRAGENSEAGGEREGRVHSCNTSSPGGACEKSTGPPKGDALSCTAFQKLRLAG